MKIADSHTHLNQLNEESIEKIMAEAPEVCCYINIGTLLDDDFSNIIKYKNIYCSYGIHPNDYLKEDDKNTHINYNNIDEAYNILKKKIISTPKCIAVGETGLDFHYGKEDSIQYDLLHMQLSLAKELNKVVSIHARGCNIKELIKIISNYKVSFVMHCYSYDLENAMIAIENGGYISFSGILTFNKNTEDLQNTAKYIPSERILIETDAPYLTPIPYRGKTNHPKYLKYTLSKLAEIRKEDINEVADYTYKNTLSFYCIKDLF